MGNVRNRSVLAFILAAVVAGLSLAPALARADDKETELQKKMEEVESGLKKLRRTLRNSAQNEDSLKTIAQVKAGLEACKKLAPSMASSLPEGERAKFVEAYRKDMDGAIAEVGKMEAAVKAGKNDEAQESLKKLKEIEDAGHEKYIKDDQKKKEAKKE